MSTSMPCFRLFSKKRLTKGEGGGGEGSWAPQDSLLAMPVWYILTALVVKCIAITFLMEDQPRKLCIMQVTFYLH